MLSRGILIVLNAFYAALFVIQVPRSFAKKKRNFTTHRFEALLYLSWKNTKNTRNAKNIIIKNYIFVKFPSKFPIHSRKLSLEKREKKLEILYTLN